MIVKLLIGLTLLFLGIGGAGFTFMINSGGGTLGPIPFFGSCFVALIGLIIILIAIFSN